MADRALGRAAFVLLCLLAEGPAHGYQIRQTLHTRGFRFWVRLERSSVYAVLASLEKQGLVVSRLEDGGGPPRKVFSLTPRGDERRQQEGLRLLARPAHPRNDLDLGLYALAALPQDEALAALDEGITGLRARAGFLRERLAWCRARELWLPALGFERPLLELEAELTWLGRVREELAAHPGRATGEGWAAYEYREPPGPDHA
jgi:DNA-binding PadR family transcriptional regulator